MSGCCSRTCSTSSGATLTPPVLIISFSRPRKRTRPSGSIEPRSPVRNQPSVERLGVELRRAEVAGRGVAQHRQLADLARRQRRPGRRIDGADGHARQRQALRGKPERQRIVRVGDGAIAVGLGRAVDGAELSGAQRLDGERDVLRRTDGEAGAHRAQPAPGMIRMLQQGARHVGHAVVHAAALALDQGQRRARLERLLQHHATAMGHDRRHRVGRAERPEQRHRQPQPVLGA